MKSPCQVKILAVNSLFLAVVDGFPQNHQPTPLKKSPFFWFVFFGQTKKMNKTTEENHGFKIRASKKMP